MLALVIDFVPGCSGDKAIVSLVKSNPRLLKFTIQTFKGNKTLSKEANALITQLSNGNMIEDKNKGISSIAYNHLNLPMVIVFNENTTEEKA